MDLNSVIQNVKAAVDIVELISSYIPVQKAGKYYKALCPFHGEKTPSFFIYPEKKFYHCFGCGVSGDSIKFLQEYEKISFMEALTELAKRSRIAIPSVTAKSDPKKLEYEEIFSQFSKYFQEELMRSDKALQYLLENRGFDRDTIAEFQLGFCAELFPSKIKHEFSGKERLLKEWGILNPDGSHRFFGRIIFPIHDRFGKIVGFSGRWIEGDDQAPKYLNTPQTDYFNKGKLFYVEHLAKKAIQEIGFAIIVEGYFDALRLHKNGIKNTVAAMGTAVSDEQLLNLKKYAKQFLFIFDNDEAGKKAAQKALFSMPTQVRSMACILSKAKDPDEYLLKFSKESFKNELLSAIPLEEFCVGEQAKKFDFSVVAGKDEFLNSVVEIVKKVKESGNLASYDSVLSMISKAVTIEKAKIEEWFEKRKRTTTLVTDHKTPDKQPVTSEIRVGSNKDNAAYPEDFIFAIFLCHPSFRQKIEGFLSEYLRYFEKRFQDFFLTIRKEFEPDEAANHMNEFLSKETIDRIFGIMSRPFMVKYDVQKLEKTLEDCFRKIQKRKSEFDRGSLDKRIQECTEVPEKNLLLKKRQEIISSQVKHPVKN